MGMGVFKGSSGYSEPVRDPKTGRVTVKPKIDDIDMQKTADLLKEAKMIQADPYRDEIKLQDEKILPEMQKIIDKAKTLKEKLYSLSNQLSPTKRTTSVFNQKEVKRYLDNGDSSDPFIQFVIDTPHLVENRRYDLTINRIAAYDQINGSQPFTTTTTAIGTTDDLVISTLDDDYTTPLSTTIDITADMSLQNVVDKINQSSLNDKIRASVIKVGDSDYRLSIRSTVTGRPITLGTSPTYTDPALTTFGVRAGNDPSQPTVTSLSAEVVYDGVTVYRHENSFSDLVTGVTINLLGATGARTATLTVDYNKTAAFSGIADFITAYTDLNDLIIKNNKLKADGTKDPDAVLYGEQILSMTKNMMLTGFGSTLVGAGSTDYVGFAAIGINFKKLDSGDLTPDKLDGSIAIVDADKLEKALLNNFEKVLKLFGQDYATDNVNFAIYEIPTAPSSSLAGENISITVSETSPSVYSATLTCGTETETVTISSGVIITDPNGFFQGLKIGYNGPNPTSPTTYSATMSFTQGLADRFQLSLTDALKPKVVEGGVIKSIGTLANEVEKIGNKQTTLKKRIESIEKEADDIVSRLNMSMGRLYEAKNNTSAIINTLNAYYSAFK